MYIYIVRFCTLNLLRSSKHLIDTITAQAVHQSLRLQKLLPLHRGCPWHATPHQVGNFTLTVFNKFKVVLQHVVCYRCYSAFFDSRLRQHRSSRGFLWSRWIFPRSITAMAHDHLAGIGVPGVLQGVRGLTSRSCRATSCTTSTTLRTTLRTMSMLQDPVHGYVGQILQCRPLMFRRCQIEILLCSITP
jgi:hypothetical protein